MSRLPIRVRLTLPFAIAMAAVLAATGAFVYVRVGSALLGSVDATLNAQISEATQHAREGRRLIDPDTSEGPFVTGVARPDGSLLRVTAAGVKSIPVRHGLTGSVRFTTEIDGLHGEWRVIEAPGRYRGARATVIVAHSLAAREETLHRLAREFLFAAPAALLVAILAGYGLAAAALRPVEAMRRRAAAVSADAPGKRLPVPPARDEVRALALTLNGMLERLEAAFEHERRFLSDASHELRTPLALLRAELELALRRPRSHGELEHALRSAAEETERLSHLAEDLLLLARADQGRLPVRPEELDALAVLERVRDRFALRAVELDRRLEVDRTRPARIEADPVRLEQALGNLVDNAFTHGAGTVTLSAQVDNGRVELHVLDEGDGVAAEFVDRAFDRFSRADDARAPGGTGLGLPIVELIARAHGGEAHIRNGPAGGSDAWISLPRVS
jgi:two-component system OmpR family sensor kinase